MVKPSHHSVNLKSETGKSKDSLRVHYLINRSAHLLREAQVEAALRSAEELLAQVMRISRARLLADREHFATLLQARRLQQLVERRAQREPLQYLLGWEEFAGMKLAVGPGVLIPRPETELVLKEAIRLLPWPGGLLADLGTGSGNLALGLALNFPAAQVYGVDISAKALAWARKNCSCFGIRRVRLLKGDAAQAIPARLHHTFSLVVSNPPYIATRALGSLQPEVRREPRLALDGGISGLKGISHMARAARQLLQPQGIFICEIGQGQAQDTIGILAETGFDRLGILNDWQNIPRVISGFQPA